MESGYFLSSCFILMDTSGVIDFSVDARIMIVYSVVYILRNTKIKYCVLAHTFSSRYVYFSGINQVIDKRGSYNYVCLK